MFSEKNEVYEFKTRSSEELGTVRCVNKEGDILFVAKDIAISLGYSKFDQAIKLNVYDEFKINIWVKAEDGRDREYTMLTEQGMYQLTLGSKKPRAKKFTMWVLDDVIPSIKKDGYYIKDIDAVLGKVIREKPEELRRILLEGNYMDILKLNESYIRNKEDMLEKLDIYDRELIANRNEVLRLTSELKYANRAFNISEYISSKLDMTYTTTSIAKIIPTSVYKLTEALKKSGVLTKNSIDGSNQITDSFIKSGYGRSIINPVSGEIEVRWSITGVLGIINLLYLEYHITQEMRDVIIRRVFNSPDKLICEI